MRGTGKYGMNMIDNLETIRNQGIREFVRIERDRWTCTACGGTINVHHRRCSVCGMVRD